MDEPIDIASEDGRKRIESLFRYAQIGACVNSVTHDVNNMLGAIMAYAELIEYTAALSDEEKRMIGQITGAVRKASAMTSNLTDIARKPHADLRRVTASDLLERLLALRGYELKTLRINFHSTCAEDLKPLTLDLPKALQALLYLFVNAMESAIETTQPIIKLRVTGDADGVEFSFWNSGDPIEESRAELIFQPFVTTRGQEHVGLGLHMAREFAAVNGGEVRYYPERGFVLRLPYRSPLPGAGA